MHKNSAADVMVDTFNLRLERGSGIKTYGITLLAALRDMGLSTALLADRPIHAAKDRVLDEVHFYDPNYSHRMNLPGRVHDLLMSLRYGYASAGSLRIEQKSVLQFGGALAGAKGLYDYVENVYRLYDTSFRAYHKMRRHTTVKLRNRPRVFHATTPVPVDVKGVTTVTTIHDVIPLKLPYTTLDDKKQFYDLCKDSIKRSELILTVSECSKRDIHEFFDVPDEKVVVTYQSLPAVPPEVDATYASALMRRHKLKPGQYVFFVGNIEPKKNVKVLVDAMAGLAHDVPLVIAGHKAWLSDSQIGHGPATLRRNFRHLDYVSRDDLHSLLANAGCMVFPSIYEGFGLPPLEAMQMGCPVISTDAASLPEVCGDAALYFDPRDPVALRTQIDRLLGDPALRADLIAKGHERVAHFSPQRYAERLKSAYDRVL